MEKKIRIGIIGCGGIANGKHMKALQKVEDCEMVALLSLAEYCLSIVILFELKSDFAKYCRYVVLAHTLKVGQA